MPATVKAMFEDLLNINAALEEQVQRESTMETLTSELVDTMGTDASAQYSSLYLSGVAYMLEQGAEVDPEFLTVANCNEEMRRLVYDKRPKTCQLVILHCAI